MNKYGKGLVVALLFSFLYFIPFVNAPYMGMDDGSFLRLANNLIRTPLDMFSSPFSCEGSDIKQRLNLVSNGPFTSYYIALVKSIFGETETRMRIAFYLFYLIAVWSVYVLAYRILGSGIVAALIFAANPYVLDSSTTIMADMPLTALFLLSIVLFIKGTDENNKLKLVSSGLLAGLAILTKYTGLLLPVLFIIYVLISKKNLSKYLPYILIPVVILFAWIIHNFIFYGYSQLLIQQTYIKSGYNAGLSGIYDRVSMQTTNLLFGRAIKVSSSVTTLFLEKYGIIGKIASPLLLVFVSLFPIAITTAHFHNKKEMLVFGGGIIALLMFVRMSGLFNNVNLLLIPFFIAGIYILLRIFIELLRGLSKISSQNEKIFLFLWFFIVLIYIIVVLPFGAQRYSLPLLAPLSILFAEKLQKNYSYRLIGLIIVSMAILGIINMHPSYTLGGIEKTQAEFDGEHYSKNNTWAGARDFIYGLYLSKQGFELFCDKGSPLVSGDVVLAGSRGGASLSEIKKHVLPGLDVILVNETSPLAGRGEFYEDKFQVFRVVEAGGD